MGWGGGDGGWGVGREKWVGTRGLCIQHRSDPTTAVPSDLTPLSGRVYPGQGRLHFECMKMAPLGGTAQRVLPVSLRVPVVQRETCLAESLAAVW